MSQSTTPNCAICNNPSTEILVHHFIYTCDTHKQYATSYNPEVVQLKLGIIKELPEKFTKCEYCGETLSDELIKNTEEDDKNILCEKHRIDDNHKWLQGNMALKWIDFKIMKPNANIKTDMRLFLDFMSAEYKKNAKK